MDTICWYDPLADWDRYDLMIVRSTWDYQERLDEFLETLARIAGSSAELQNPKTLAIATEDPVAFLDRHQNRVIFDEFQGAPHLLSYLQGIVDEVGSPVQFVSTGSHQLALRDAVSQSLAGRTGILHLLPLSIAELATADMPLDSF